MAKGECPGAERDKRPGRRKMKQNKTGFPKLSEARNSDPHRRVAWRLSCDHIPFSAIAQYP